jgi:hypothetical protein
VSFGSGRDSGKPSPAGYYPDFRGMKPVLAWKYRHHAKPLHLHSYFGSLFDLTIPAEG